LAARLRGRSQRARSRRRNACGGLASSAGYFADMFRRAPSHVDRILRGAKPGDLPVELPTRHKFIINLKTARAIGLDISPDMLSIADEGIE
jgi:putative ABC transport system substrate-binding protein